MTISITHSSNPKSGYSTTTKIYRNPNPLPPLPPQSTPLTITDLAFSLLHSSYNHNSSALNSIPFLIDAGVEHHQSSITFTQFHHQVNSLSSFLHSSSSPPLIRRGDIALILAPTSIHLPVLYFSLLSLGIIIAPVNPISTPSELTHITHLIKPSVIFTVSNLITKLPSHLKTSIILIDSISFNSILTQQTPTPFHPSVPIPQSDTAVILFSSGTTGQVKGVEITHRALITSIAGNYHTQLREEGVGPNRRSGTPVNLFTVPLFHIYGFYFLIWSVAMAETAVLNTNGRFDLEGMLRVVERFNVTILPVSPPIVVALVKSNLTKKMNLQSLKKVVCGGAPLGPDVVQRFKMKFPAVHLIQGYGLTEVGGSVTKSIEDVDPVHYGSVGLLTELIEARIVDPLTGESLPPGRKGELWLRTPSVMKGYVGNLEATKATFGEEGWLKTGDLCYFDSDGFLFVVDRLKELIKYKGYQVAPAELEHVLLSHPEIADAAVVPYPDEDAGQIPIAFVVRKHGSNVSEAQIMQFVAKQVSPYKKVRRVTFIKEIPKSPAGKILRRKLVQQAISIASASL